MPLTYNRDLQEDKPPLFDSLDTLRLILAVNTEMIGAMELREENCRAAAADPMLLATDLADYLVKKGVPFRHAHELVGKAVAEAIRSRTPLDQLDLAAIDPAFGPEAKEVFSAGARPRRPHQSRITLDHQCEGGNRPLESRLRSGLSSGLAKRRKARMFRGEQVFPTSRARIRSNAS